MVFCVFWIYIMKQQANLGDLITMTGLVILLKLGSNWFFSPCDHEIWWMTLKSNRAPLLYYVNLWASFQIHRWIQTGVTVRKLSIRVKIVIFLSRVTLKFDEWPWKTIRHLLCTTLSFVHHFTAIGEFKDRDKDKIKEDLGSIGLGWPLVTPSHMYAKWYKKKPKKPFAVEEVLPFYLQIHVVFTVAVL